MKVRCTGRKDCHLKDKCKHYDWHEPIKDHTTAIISSGVIVNSDPDCVELIDGCPSCNYDNVVCKSQQEHN